MNNERIDFGITYDNKRQNIYVFGGLDGIDEMDICEKYSIEDDEWTVMSTMPKKKYLVSACIFNNEFIFVIGGYDGFIDDTYLNDIDKYDIVND